MIDSALKAEQFLMNDLNEQNFESFAIDLFRFQASAVPIYNKYLKHLGVNPLEVTKVWEIPFMPISFFKRHRVLLEGIETSLYFETSGTTGSETGKHYIAKASLYDWSYQRCFNHFMGTSNYALLALLPNYLERGNSSLVYMVDGLIQASNTSDSGFFLHDFDSLIKVIKLREANKQTTLLWGVSYALLDLCEHEKLNLKYTRVLETGGMKGRRKELIKDELHKLLKNGFGVDTIYSEYGMTELLSQAYSLGNNRFSTPLHMAVFMRDTTDPFNYVSTGETGGINIIDLANIYSCAFIQTEDLGKLHADGTFEILGRFDSAEVRGCNLLVQ